MTFNYWVVGLHQPLTEDPVANLLRKAAHLARLPHKAALGQTLAYEDWRRLYRIVACKEGEAGCYGELRLECLSDRK